MKKYICLNHGECNWADEIPPREFSLDEVDANCPNCGSANIREPVSGPNGPKRFLPFIAGAVLLLGLIWFFWPVKKTTKEETLSVLAENDTVAENRDSTKPVVDTTNVVIDTVNRVGSDSVQVADDPVIPPVKPNKTPIIWTMVEGSGFCDPDLNGTFLYTERNNLGQERERKVLNKVGCYPANN